MTGCSADYCTNSDKKGFKMCRFPLESKRRKIWIENCNKPDWVPGSGAALCQIHFEESMWDFVNGKRYLKKTAIPTIFEKGPTLCERNIISEGGLTQKVTIDHETVEEDMEDTSDADPVTIDESENMCLFRGTCANSINGSESSTLNNTSLNTEQLQRLEKLEKLYQASEHSRISLQRKLNAARKQIKRLQKTVGTQELQKSISKIFNNDQVGLLCNLYKKIPQWCSETIVKALKLRFACGSAGYQEMLNQNFPLPCIRTLTRKLENLKFCSGINEEVLQFLSIKVSHFAKSIDKDCILLLDEISIKPGNFYDASTNSFIGYVTLPGHNENEIATHGLVFMLAGLSSRWKQSVAFYLTGDSVKGDELKPICEKIILKSEAMGLRVHAITSDMSPANQAMWRAFGIHASKFSTVVNSCEHPAASYRKLFFNADTPHAFKNIKAAFISNTYFKIPDKFVEKYKLPSDLVKSSYVKDIIIVDENCELKLAPKLRKEMLDPDNHFMKMRVSNSTKVFSDDISIALEFLTEQNPKDERLTTAWFISFIARWFAMMSNRSITLALSKSNNSKYIESISYLKEFIDLFTNIKIGIKGSWKPFQTAVLISTTTVIELSELLLSNYGFQFFFTSRLSQDCLENLFSIVRLKNAIPNALQLKNNLKLITVSQYMKIISNSNYEHDDRQFLSEFLEFLLKNRCPTTHYLKNSEISCEMPDISDSSVTYNRTELNLLYHIAGYIMTKILMTQKTCPKCINETRSESIVCYSFNELTRLKARKQKCFFVNISTFRFFIQMETIFRIYYKHVCNKKLNLKRFFTTKYNEIVYTLPECHNLKQKIILRYYAFRVRVKSKSVASNRRVTYASKTMAMHENIR